MRVFISYASEDRKVAKVVAESLRDAGYDVYPDTHWPKNVEAAVKRADAFVVLLSPEAVGSPFVSQEIKLALGAERLEDHVIPVVLEPSTQVPWILRTMRPITATTKPESTAEAVKERLEGSADSTTTLR
jgi:hypothetical protein